MPTYVELNRQFSRISLEQDPSELEEFYFLGLDRSKSWEDLDEEFRTVILAEAGSGKTEELRHHAQYLRDQGRFSFFIRIEDISDTFQNSFEIGTEAQFSSWEESSSEAWFFLDSVDEARLGHPRDFERAIRRFTKAIQYCSQRAHIYISSRPYAWRPEADRRLLDDELFFANTEEQDSQGDSPQDAGPTSALKIYVLEPLNSDQIRIFGKERSTPDIDGFIEEIERAHLWTLAERPFDLEGMLEKWGDDTALGTRRELIRYNIEKRLQDVHNVDRADRQPLNLEHALVGARRLAAAVLLTGEPSIRVPDNNDSNHGIDAKEVLSDWDPGDVRALLERGVFNEVLYGSVRFRHRDVRELLAAEWFHKLLQEGHNRAEVESLFFRNQYGVEFVSPRLRPVLPWLVLLDDRTRARAAALSPEILVEGGDPSQLDLAERTKLLKEIVSRIVSDSDTRSARDNNAIARIAQQDLSTLTYSLIEAHSNNDDAIFFLGRLVWQGEMSNCVPLLMDIVLDSTRGIYSRIASIRAVAACGSEDQIGSIWQELIAKDEEIPRQILAELVSGVVPNAKMIQYLISALDNLPPYERYSSTGLGTALHRFVDRFATTNSGELLAELLAGFRTHLEQAPYIERRDCRVSEEFAWLLSPAIHGVEILIRAEDPLALGPVPLSVMMMVPSLRFWRQGEYDEYKTNLRDLVPAWPELNDALYWASINQARDATQDELTDDWRVSWLGHYWEFDEGSFPRLVQYIGNRPSKDDRLVALSTAFRIFVNADRPPEMLNDLNSIVSGDSDLQNQLDSYLNPKISEEESEYQEEEREFERKHREREEKAKVARETWIAELQKNPDRVRNPTSVKPGEITKDHCWLRDEICRKERDSNRHGGERWELLSVEFGEEVALAYRDAVTNHWRHYKPPERQDRQRNSTPYAVILGLSGLEIDFKEAGLIDRLDEALARHALSYITWELNGFPTWLEAVYRKLPILVEETVTDELQWELQNSTVESPTTHFLQDLVYHSPWLHGALASTILDWAEQDPGLINQTVRHYILELLFSGDADKKRLINLARQQILREQEHDQLPGWYALLVDCDPSYGIEETRKWLSALDPDAAASAGQLFTTALIGSRRTEHGGTRFREYKTPQHLKDLFMLSSEFIRYEDDLDRSRGGVHSPELRDDAQEARDQLFTWLSEIPGKESYYAIEQLALEHPDPNTRSWMNRHAQKRAQLDGDLEHWTASQVAAFGTTHKLRPNTHRQLFDTGVRRLYDLKHWLESGNDSPWKTWSRVEDEPEMRTLIAGWLNQQSAQQYTTAQEPELANSQRMDIWLSNPDVASPVPIELKLLDKGWSGPKLCERLKNQLVGDYLRESSADCGVFLLVWQGSKPDRRWRIGKHNVDVTEIKDALTEHWNLISPEYPKVQAIEVVLLDLTIRKHHSNE